jgi:hypothetical protein
VRETAHRGEWQSPIQSGRPRRLLGEAAILSPGRGPGPKNLRSSEPRGINHSAADDGEGHHLVVQRFRWVHT